MESQEQPFLVPSDSLALDLLNTLRVEAGRTSDALASPRDAVTWLVDTGQTELQHPSLARILLTEARRLRADIARLVEAHQAGAPLPAYAVEGLNRVLEAGPVHAWLSVGVGAPCVEEREAGHGPLAALAPVARAAAELVAHADPARIRRCASQDCSRWFVDTSKGGRRKWCSMATCGNRAKAARHRERGAAV